MSEVQLKEASMVSTYMSKNQSAGDNGFFNAQMRKQALLQYAKQPLSKDLPRWTQSASTWRHTSHRYSFSKDQRFKDEKLNYSDVLEPNLPSTNNNKSCTFGKGTRKPISEVILRNAKQKPSPNAHDLEIYNQQPRSARYGRTFGIGWKNYQRVHIPHRKDVYSGHLTQKNPPAHYQIRQIPGKHKRAFSTYGRLKMFTQQMADITRGNPGACHKIKDRHIQNNIGLNQRSFGFGQRINLSAPANDFPQAIYFIPGFCQKFINTKRKLTPRQNNL